MMRARLAGEAGDEPARDFVALARDGWAASRDARPVTNQQWAAMRAVVGGVLPVWKPMKPNDGESEKRAKEVSGNVRAMQTLVHERIAAHTERGAVAAKWVEQREQQRPFLSLVLRAWRGVCDQAGVGGRVASVMNHAPLGRSGGSVSPPEQGRLGASLRASLGLSLIHI